MNAPLFDSWFTAAKLITFIRRQEPALSLSKGWHVICALKSNRILRRLGQPGQSRVVKLQVRQWAKELRYTPYTRVRVEAADDTVTTYLVRSLTGRLNRVPFDVCVLISKRTRRDKHPAYFLCTDLALNPQTVLKYYLLRWPCEVNNWYLKEALGLADYQLQKLEAIAKYHAVVFLALAYLQWRAVRSALRDRTALSTLADLIHQHRQEHYRQLVEAVARMTLQVGAIEPVLDHFLRQSPPRPLPVTPLVQPVPACLHRQVAQIAPGHTWVRCRVPPTATTLCGSGYLCRCLLWRCATAPSIAVYYPRPSVTCPNPSTPTRLFCQSPEELKSTLCVSFAVAVPRDPNKPMWQQYSSQALLLASVGYRMIVHAVQLWATATLNDIGYGLD